MPGNGWLSDRELWLSLLTWIGLVTILVGAVLLVRKTWRRKGIALMVAGGAVFAVAGFIPAGVYRIASPENNLDEHVPKFEFYERHSLFIRAPQDRVYKAIEQVTAGEIQYFGLFTRLRRLGQNGGESILHAPENQPLLAVAVRSGFRVLAEAEGCEIVFQATVAPGVLATMNFLLEEGSRGSTLLSTETRVHATSDTARRGFARYWRVIYPGSSILRKTWLEAIARRAMAKSLTRAH